MSLEVKIESLTIAIIALTAAMAGQAPKAPTAPPAAVPLANGMPGGPFGTQAPPAAAPPAFAAPAAPGAPFHDLAGITKYATDTYYAMEAKGVGRGEVITHFVRHLCGSGSVNDLPVAKYPDFFAEMERQKLVS